MSKDKYTIHISGNTEVTYNPNPDFKADSFLILENGIGWGCSEEAVRAMITLLKDHQQPNITQFRNPLKAVSNREQK